MDSQSVLTPECCQIFQRLIAYKSPPLKQTQWHTRTNSRRHHSTYFRTTISFFKALVCHCSQLCCCCQFTKFYWFKVEQIYLIFCAFGSIRSANLKKQGSSFLTNFLREIFTDQSAGLFTTAFKKSSRKLLPRGTSPFCSKSILYDSIMLIFWILTANERWVLTNWVAGSNSKTDPKVWVMLNVWLSVTNFTWLPWAST